MIKRQKQIKEIIKNQIKILDFDKCDLDYIFSRRNTNRFKQLLKHNPPESLSKFELILKKLQKFGAINNQEIYLIVYGPNLGKIEWEKRKKKYGVTLKNLQLKYGDSDGKIKFDQYREKQAYSNTIEYKNEKYGWDSDTFDSFNKSRAVTLKNLQLKYGDSDGKIKFDQYREKQAYTNSKDHLKDKYEHVNFLKSHTLSSYKYRLGDSDGLIAFEKYVMNAPSGYSKISQELFHQLISIEPFKSYDCYFAEHNKEYGVLTEFGYKKYDFVCPNLKICIEFHGDHYHGNPALYLPNDYLRGKGCTKIKAKDKWKEDDIKKSLIEELRNFNVLIIWEKDYISNKEEIVNRILNYVTRK